MSLVMPQVPNDVQLHIHFSNLVSADDLMPNFTASLATTDLLVLEMLGWNMQLQNQMIGIAKSTNRPESVLHAFGQATPYMQAITQHLYTAEGTPYVAFNDFPENSDSVHGIYSAHKTLSRFEELVVLRRDGLAFNAAVCNCKELCTAFTALQVGRMNHMLTRFRLVVNRARKQVAGLKDQRPLRVLMLLGIDHIDMLDRFKAAADTSSTFVLSSSCQPAVESCMLAQVREYTATGALSDVAAARLIARTLLINARCRGDSKALTPALRDGVDLEVATMDIDDIRRLYES